MRFFKGFPVKMFPTVDQDRFYIEGEHSKMLESYLETLRSVVDLDCGSHNVEGVTRVAEIMKANYESIGFHAELVDLGPTVGKGVFATNKPGAEHFDIMLNGHLDTVFPDGEAAKRPFKVENGRTSGPGNADCKAGVVSMFYGLKLAKKEDLDRLAIAVCLNPDEEISSPASRGWLQEMAKKCDRAMVFECARANGELIKSRKGRAVWEVKFHGVPAHAGNNPQDGRSSILAAARFSLEVSKLQDLEGKGVSVTVGTIQGGTVPNTVPEWTTIRIDTRRRNDRDGEELDAAIAEMAKQCWGEGVVTEATRVSLSPAMPHTGESDKLVKIINEAARLEGYDARWVDSGGGSDANRIAAVGTPVVDGCGPAGACFHSDKEWMDISTVESRSRMLSRVLSLI